MDIWKGEPLANNILKEIKDALRILGAYSWINVITRDNDNPYCKGIIKDARDCHTVVHTMDAPPKAYGGAYISLDPSIKVPDRCNMDGGYTTPCTAEAILRMLKWKGFRLEGANVVIIGRSERVGAPLAHLLTEGNATVTLAHSYTPTYSLWRYIAYADLVISCTGNPEIGNKYRQFKAGATLIDVGGDFAKNVPTNVEHFVPHIGGIGPITRAVLLEHAMTYNLEPRR